MREIIFVDEDGQRLGRGTLRLASDREILARDVASTLAIDFSEPYDPAARAGATNFLAAPPRRLVFAGNSPPIRVTVDPDGRIISLDTGDDARADTARDTEWAEALQGWIASHELDVRAATAPSDVGRMLDDLKAALDGFYYTLYGMAPR